MKGTWASGHLLEFLCFKLLGAVIEQFLVHLHEEFQGVVYQTMNCPVGKTL